MLVRMAARDERVLARIPERSRARESGEHLNGIASGGLATQNVGGSTLTFMVCARHIRVHTYYNRSRSWHARQGDDLAASRWTVVSQPALRNLLLTKQSIVYNLGSCVTGCLRRRGRREGEATIVMTSPPRPNNSSSRLRYVSLDEIYSTPLATIGMRPFLSMLSIYINNRTRTFTPVSILRRTLLCSSRMPQTLCLH